MDLQQKEKIEQINRIIVGMRTIFQLLETPGVPPVSDEVLVVLEVLLEVMQGLIKEIVS